MFERQFLLGLLGKVVGERNGLGLGGLGLGLVVGSRSAPAVVDCSIVSGRSAPAVIRIIGSGLNLLGRGPTLAGLLVLQLRISLASTPAPAVRLRRGPWASQMASFISEYRRCGHSLADVVLSVPVIAVTRKPTTAAFSPHVSLISSSPCEKLRAVH